MSMARPNPPGRNHGGTPSRPRSGSFCVTHQPRRPPG